MAAGKIGPSIGYKTLVKEEQKQFRRIERAVAAGKIGRAKNLTKQYFGSYAAKRVATRAANNRKKVDPEYRVSKARELEIAASLDPWSETGEKVLVWPKQKENGDSRLIMSFGVVNRAHQKLVYNALRAWDSLLLHPSQYTVRGGRHMACEKVLETLGEGYTFAIQLDIKECFQSFDEEEIPGLLPVPEEVTKRVLVSRHLNLVTSNSLHDNDLSLVKARQGIPQGSAASNYVAEALLAPVLHELPESSRVFLYCDNFLGLAHTEHEAELIASTLRLALMNHPAGPLPTTTEGPTDAADGFEFLGYRFSLEDGKPVAKPSDRNFTKCNGRMAWFAQTDLLSDDDALHEGCLSLKSWCAAFREWQFVDQWQAAWFQVLTRARLTMSL